MTSFSFILFFFRAPLNIHNDDSRHAYYSDNRNCSYGCRFLFKKLHVHELLIARGQRLLNRIQWRAPRSFLRAR